MFLTEPLLDFFIIGYILFIRSSIVSFIFIILSFGQALCSGQAQCT
jgi:hypothetical protein